MLALFVGDMRNSHWDVQRELQRAFEAQQRSMAEAELLRKDHLMLALVYLTTLAHQTRSGRWFRGCVRSVRILRSCISCGGREWLAKFVAAALAACSSQTAVLLTVRSSESAGQRSYHKVFECLDRLSNQVRGEHGRIRTKPHDAFVKSLR